MKLRNKLLPLVGVATACAAIAPVALTSCSSNNNGWIDLMQKYNSTVKALDNQTLTTENAKKAYFGYYDTAKGVEHWKSDDEVIAQFKDDYLWWLYKDEDSKRNYSEAKVKIDYFTVGHPTFTPTGKGEEPYKIPTFTFKAEFVGSYTETEYGVTTTIKYEVTNTVANVPFAVWFNSISGEAGQDKTWFITPDVNLIYENDSSTSRIAWSVTEDIKATTMISIPEYGYETTETTESQITSYTGAGYFDEFFNSSLKVTLGAKSHYMLSVQNGDKE